jgi:Zn-dependent peptidase ImmA (M78 family)
MKQKESQFPTVDVPHIPARSIAEIEQAAEECRKHWKISPDGPIYPIGHLLERHGVIIVNHLVKSPKVDAFSRYGKTSVIFLNRSVPSPSRWHYDIAHECGHLVLHRGIPTGSIQTEEEANRFASAFLMPKAAFSREFKLAPFSWNHVFKLKARWQTSAASIVRRAYLSPLPFVPLLLDLLDSAALRPDRWLQKTVLFRYTAAIRIGH